MAKLIFNSLIKPEAVVHRCTAKAKVFGNQRFSDVFRGIERKH